MLIPNAELASVQQPLLAPPAKPAPPPLNARPQLEELPANTATPLQVDVSPKHALVPFQYPLLQIHALTTPRTVLTVLALLRPVLPALLHADQELMVPEPQVFALAMYVLPVPE